MTDFKRQSIAEYFMTWKRDLVKAKRLLEITEFHLEGTLILSCYVGALASLRFPGRKDAEAYKMVVRRYSGLKATFDKVDLLFFYQWPRSDFRRHRDYVKLKHYSRIKRILVARFGNEKTMKENPKIRYVSIPSLIKHLLTKRFKGFDPQNLRSKLPLFSLCEILYRYVRCYAVHNKLFPLVREHWSGPNELWYEDAHLITGGLLFQTVTNIVDNLEQECLAKRKWPAQLRNR